MMYNPEGDKHPTTERLGGEDEHSVVERIPGGEVWAARINETITPEDEERLRSKILAAMTQISGVRLTTMSELVRHCRGLSARATTGTE